MMQSSVSSNSRCDEHKSGKGYKYNLSFQTTGEGYPRNLPKTGIKYARRTAPPAPLMYSATEPARLCLGQTSLYTDPNRCQSENEQLL